MGTSVERERGVMGRGNASAVRRLGSKMISRMKKMSHHGSKMISRKKMSHHGSKMILR